MIFVNVGQGDGVVLRIGGKIVVSDAGETFAAPRMAGVLRSLGAEQIDVAILSHPHDDHVGGFVDLFREFPPRLVLASANRHWSSGSTKRLVLNEISRSGASIRWVEAGDRFGFGGASWQILNPPAGEFTAAPDAGNSSVVYLLSVHGRRLLFAGDIEERVATRLASSWKYGRVDVFLVPNQGSKHGASAELLEAISPRFAVVSVGENLFGHPAAETLYRLRAVGAQVFRTDEQGSLRATVGPDGGIVWKRWRDAVAQVPIPVFENETISAEKLAETLEEYARVALRETRVVGDVNLSQFPSSDWLLIDADKVTFTGRVTLGDNGRTEEKQPDVRIREAVFGGPVTLFGRFGELEIVDSAFRDDVSLRGSVVQLLYLNSSTFSSSADLSAMRVHVLKLEDTSFKETADFSASEFDELTAHRVKATSPIVITWSQFGRRWTEKFKRTANPHEVEATLFFWRRNFADLGRVRDAREVDVEIIKLRREKFMNWRDLDWWFAYGLEPWNRFGTRPYRPVWIGALLIGLYAVLYAVFLPFRRTAGRDETSEHPPRFFGVLFSIENFVPIVTVSDVKDWGWEPRPSWRGVVASQRVLGFAVTALAAYSIGSYVL